jgi:endothelin-converting enzyme/putative endopeptidase
VNRSRLPLVLLLAVGTASAGSLHGIIPDDIDRNANACTDFFQYANGAWRKEHPIPDYMDRWSRRWESGEVNKEHVRDILTEVSAKHDWPQGSAQQLSGDYYAACMDDTAVDKAGLAPVKPWLDEVGAIKSRGDIQRTIRHLQDVGVAVPFALGSMQDPHEPTRVIAGIGASGLGLPDRDYYLKPEPRFVEARDRYLEHVA